MVKKIKREQPQTQNEEENIALEEDAAKEEIALLEQEGDYAEETSVESINLEEELNEKADALKAEFAKPFNAKGKKITAEKLLPFPWDKKPAAKKDKQLTREEQRRRMERMVANLGDELI